jgi:glutamate/tyrosine decarboxylase-like PLP-dependent enzyme
MGNIHPRFWGWVIGTGTPLGVLAEMLAAGLNPNVGGGDHVAASWSSVLNWCKEMVGYPPDASGLLVSGGSMANLVGLTVARNSQAGFDIRKEGLKSAPRPMVLYASNEVHSSVQKAVELLGLGSEALHLIPVDPHYRMQVSELETAIQADREAGLHPFCVVGNAGTVNTGAFDDLNALADLCQRENLWLHVDGAFGALAALSPHLQYLTSGMQRADSLAFDLHKWMYMPYEVGVALVRSETSHRQAFSLTPEYLEHNTRGLAAGKIWLSDYGVQLSRGFRALKVWMSIKAEGIEKFARLIEQNVEQARYLASLVDQTPELERLAPVPLNIVCFRYRANELDEESLNALNRELLVRLHESGVAVPSYTTLNGKYALRVCITNHRSQRTDFNMMLEKVLSIGNDLFAEKI